jgi:hypothetical protein
MPSLEARMVAADPPYLCWLHKEPLSLQYKVTGFLLQRVVSESELSIKSVPSSIMNILHFHRSTISKYFD